MPYLLTTKLYIPRRRPNAVSRPRLIEQLKMGIDRNLTLITAPAGFGKTTLLSEWIPQSERCVTWVSLDEGDNDPARFWAYFIAGLQMLNADIGMQALVLLQSPQPPPIEAILTSLLNEITGFPDYFAHVLDDYQVIHTQPIHAAIKYFLEHMPPHMHLVISSRIDPPLPLGRLRARDQLNEVRSDDLRFTADESAVFLNRSMGLNLSTENVISLEAHTEGWIAGLQLAGLALQGHGPQPDVHTVSKFIQVFNGSHRYIVSYLVEEVLNQQPPNHLDFLLNTSILDRLSGPLCDYVLRETRVESSNNGSLDHISQFSILDSQSILEQLEHANLFVIPLDEEGKWYRYHHLFAEVLQHRLKHEMPERIADLQLRASEWFEQSGLVPEAVRHAIKAEDWERAARLIEQNAISFGSKGQFHLILSWLAALPEPVMHSHPLLCIFHAGALMHNNNLEAAETRLQDAEGSIQVETPADRASLILGRVFMLRSNIVRIKGDLCGSVELAQQALDLLPETEIVSRASAGLNLAYRFLISGDVQLDNERLVISALESVRATGNVYTTLRGTTMLAKVHALQGHLHRSEEIYVEAISGQNEISFLTGIPGYYFGLGDLKREWNQLDESENLLALAMAQARWQVFDGDVVMHGYQSLARLKQARGDTEGAKAILAEFTQLAHQHHFSDSLLATLGAIRAWLDLMVDNVSAATQWAETRGIQSGDKLSFPREREYLTLARLYIRLGRDHPKDDHVQKALQLLDRLQTAAQADGRMGSVIEILGIQAVAFQVMGDRDQARKSIAQAITLASPEGYIRTFVDEGEPMRILIADFRLLINKQSNGSVSLLSYIDRLLAAFPGTTPTALPIGKQQSPIRNLPEYLSDRELAVLHLIAAGASNAEIAETLSIALSTVKRHTGNLYGKLGVNSRTQAVARAQQLGLLS